MEIIFDLLQDIRKRPNLYLGEASLELLNAFIGGCSFYCLKVNGYYPEFFPGFQEFVQTATIFTRYMVGGLLLVPFVLTMRKHFTNFLNY